MNDVPTACHRFVILADESADWKVAGLRQLERLVLAVNELAESSKSETKIDIGIFWEPEIPSKKKWLPNEATLGQCRIVFGPASLPPEIDCLEHVLSTRLLVRRRGLAQFVVAEAAAPIYASASDEKELWQKRWQSFEEVCQKTVIPDGDRLWRYLGDQEEIARCERWLLRASGKSNDGIVARFLHRPISRAISRLLLKTQITPNQWSIWTMIVPLIGCVFLWRGTYAGFIIGAALYQLHNILDGCDGEIARAKYLESEHGRQVDAFVDLGATVLLALSVGIGLWRYEATVKAARVFYLLEGFIAAFLLALQWWISYRGKTSFGHLSRRALGFEKKSEFSSFHECPKTIFGRARWLLVEVTKRDVSHFFFLLLAIAGTPAWILHFLFAYALFGFALTVIALSRSPFSPRPD